MFNDVYCFIAISHEMRTYRHIAIKNETSAKHLRQISKRNSIILCKAQYKKLKIYTNITKIVFHFYKNCFNIVVDQWFSKFKSYSSLSRLCRYPHIYNKFYLRKIAFCY